VQGALVGRPAGFVTEEMNDALCRAEEEIRYTRRPFGFLGKSHVGEQETD